MTAFWVPCAKSKGEGFREYTTGASWDKGVMDKHSKPKN